VPARCRREVRREVPEASWDPRPAQDRRQRRWRHRRQSGQWRDLPSVCHSREARCSTAPILALAGPTPTSSTPRLTSCSVPPSAIRSLPVLETYWNHPRAESLQEEPDGLDDSHYTALVQPFDVRICQPKKPRFARLALVVVAVVSLSIASVAAGRQPKRDQGLIGKVRTIVAGVLGISSDKLGDDTRLGSLPRPADDLDVVEIVLALEEAFAIEIPDAEIERASGGIGRAADLAALSRNLTLGKLVALVQKQLDQKAKGKERRDPRSR
jgi:acyl carrier protein